MSDQRDERGAESWDAESWDDTRLATRQLERAELAPAAGGPWASDNGADELDRLLRRTMRALDDQIPSGTFDALSRRIDASLDQGDSAQGSSAALLEASDDRAEDSYHDAEPAEIDDELAVRRRPRPSTATGRGRGRRHLLTTEVVGPHSWWQARGLVWGVGAASLGVAAILIAVVVRKSRSEAPELGASSWREPGTGVVVGRRSPAIEEELPDAAELTRRALRAELAPVLPAARACLGTRPTQPISLELTVAQSGEIRDLGVRGPLPETKAARCIADAVRGITGGKLAPRAQAQTVSIPLY